MEKGRPCQLCPTTTGSCDPATGLAHRFPAVALQRVGLRVALVLDTARKDQVEIFADLLQQDVHAGLDVRFVEVADRAGRGIHKVHDIGTG